MSKAKKTVLYKQCTYRSPTKNGYTVETAWLPAKLAIVGKTIYFGKKTNKPDRLWTITSVSDGHVSEQYLLEHERDYKTQREASDI